MKKSWRAESKGQEKVHCLHGPFNFGTRVLEQPVVVKERV